MQQRQLPLMTLTILKLKAASHWAKVLIIAFIELKKPSLAVAQPAK